MELAQFYERLSEIPDDCWWKVIIEDAGKNQLFLFHHPWSLLERAYPVKGANDVPLNFISIYKGKSSLLTGLSVVKGILS
jgi:hypothetical protein